MEYKEEFKRKGNSTQHPSKGNSNSSNKAKSKGVYLGKNRLSNEELQSYRKDNKCFNCGEQGHVYRTCPKRKPRNAPPRASMVEASKEDGHHKGSSLPMLGVK